MHIKLGLFKNFVKVMDQDGSGFRYLQENFPTKTDEKLKAGVFIHCKKFWVIALPNFGQMYALPKKNGQKPNFFWV